MTTDDLAETVRAQLTAYRELRQNMPVRAALASKLGLSDLMVSSDDLDRGADARLRPMEHAVAREQAIAARIACRVNELQNLPLTVPSHLAIRARAELKACVACTHDLCANHCIRVAPPCCPTTSCLGLTVVHSRRPPDTYMHTSRSHTRHPPFRYKLLAYQRELKRRLLPLLNSHSSPGTALVMGALKRPSAPVIRTLAATLQVETRNRECVARQNPYPARVCLDVDCGVTSKAHVLCVGWESYSSWNCILPLYTADFQQRESKKKLPAS
jgi:hypothetical protein